MLAAGLLASASMAQIDQAAEPSYAPVNRKLQSSDFYNHRGCRKCGQNDCACNRFKYDYAGTTAAQRYLRLAPVQAVFATAPRRTDNNENFFVIADNLTNSYFADEDGQEGFDPTEGATRTDEDGEDTDDFCCEEEDECFEYGGWIQQGYSYADGNPADQLNGVVGLNDRHNNYMMNQLWLYMNHEVDNDGYGWDYGGEVVAVYGTDGEFFQMVDGLEATWNQTDRFYQLALLRFYFDVAYDDWTFRMGRFDALVGYEPFEATEMPFYSHSYNFNYGTPGSVFGAMATRAVTDQISINAGIHRGADQFNDTDGLDSINFLGGVSWESCDEDSWMDFQIIAEENGPGDNTNFYSVSGGTMLTDRLEWVISYAYGETSGLGAEWYGINQHFIYEINPCWTFAARFEYFRDDDGVAVGALRAGNPAVGPFVGNFYELTLALNWEPRENLALRPEIRWDWFDADAPGGPRPFDAGGKDEQFLASIDLILAF